MMTKARTVMEFAQDDGGVVWFSNEDEDTPMEEARQVQMPRSDWEAMGCPQTITVTFEPGDLLNGDVADEIDGRIRTDPFTTGDRYAETDRIARSVTSPVTGKR